MRTFDLPRTRTLAMPLLVLSFFSGNAGAQQTGVLHPPLQQPTLPAFGSQLPDSDFRLPPADEKKPPLAPSTAGFFVQEIRFTGNTRIASEELGKIAADYHGRTLSTGEIEDLRLRLTRRYVDAGYINSGVILRPGDYANGVLTFTVIEGALSFIRLRGLEGLHEDYVVDRLLPDQDAPLNINDLRDRFQLLLADPLFAQAQARLIPDTQPGRAILDIDAVRARPYQLTLSANNYRTASLGEYTLSLSGWVRNLTGRGDYLELGLQQGEESIYGNNRRSLLWNMPLNARGTEIGLSADSARATVLEAPLKPAKIESAQESREIRLSQRLYESLQERFVAGISYGQRSNRSYMLGLPFSFSAGENNGVTHIESWRLWGEYSRRWENQAMVLRSTLSRNHNDLTRGPGVPENTNLVWLGQAHFAHRLADSTQVSLRATAQRTAERLPSMDRLAIGGYQSVRGFRENLLLQDHGEFLNIDVDHLVWSDGKNGSLSLGLFHDLGGGSSRGGARMNLNASGITVKGSFGNLSAELAWALRHERPDALGATGNSLQDKGVHLQIAYRCFD